VEAFDYIGSVASGLVYLALGSRLVWLGARARSAPESLLGSVLLVWSSYYALRIISIGFHDQPALESQIFITSRIVDNLGSVGLAFFPLLLFRRGSSWAKWLATTVAICLIAGVTGSILVGDPEGVDPLTNGWWWLEWFGQIAPGIWLGTEGFHQYGMTRPRIRLGLCEPIAGHRYLLLGLGGMFWALVDFVVIGQYIDYWATQNWSATLDNVVGLLEIAALTMIWLAYFAPAAYRRRIAGTSPAAEPDEA
jgi:hypothetical protein